MEFQNLQSLLNRATAPASEEEAKHYCSRFTTLVNQEPDGSSRAITLLIGKVQSQNEPVALRAIHVMDQCSKYCGKSFQTQVGKFKFLNELIKLVSPKYAGNQTPTAVRSAIVQQLKLWAVAFKDQPKIIEAYNMLEKTGNTKIQTVKKSEFAYAAGEDAAKAALLASLLKSKNKQDLETANKMIKDMVAAEGRKAEQDMEMLSQVAMIQNNGRLLAEMLSSSDHTLEESTLLDELHKTCVDLRPKLYRLAGQLSDSAQLSSVVDAGETLNKAIEQYELRGGKGGSRAPPQVTVYQPPNVQGSTSITASPALVDRESTSLINLEEEVGTIPASSETLSADDFDDFLSSVSFGGKVASNIGTAPSNLGTTPSNLGTAPSNLGTAPSNLGTTPSNVTSQPISSIATPNITTATPLTTSSNGSMDTVSSGLFGGMTVQPPSPAVPQPVQSVSQPGSQPGSQPVSIPATQSALQPDSSSDFADPFGLLSFDTAIPSQPKQAQTTSNTASLLDDLFSSPRESSGSGGFSLLDSGGADSLGALLEPMAVFQPTVTPAQDKPSSEAIGDSFDLLIPDLSGATFNNTPKPKPTLSELSVPCSTIGTASPISTTPIATTPISSPSLHRAPVPPARDVLLDVEVPLTLIRPSTLPPSLVHDSSVGVRVNLYHTENKPEPEVAVWLLTISNSSTARFDDVMLQITSGQGKFKLAKPSSKSLSPFSPICPSSPIQQVLLTVGNVSSLDYTLKYDMEHVVGTIDLK